MKSSQRGPLDQKRLTVLVGDAENRSITKRKGPIVSSKSRRSQNGVPSLDEKVGEVRGLPNDDSRTLMRDNRKSRSSFVKATEKIVDEYVHDATETDTVPSASTGSPVINPETFNGLQQGSDCNFTSTCSTTSFPREKMSKSELQESRRKAAARLISKRKELHMQSLQEIDSKRQDCTLHRVKWRANAKGKRSEELDRQVDKFILRDVILNNPQALAFADQHDFDCVTGRFDESVWGDLLNGLELPHSRNNEGDREEENHSLYPRISEQILNSVGLSSGTKLNHRSKFDGEDDIPVRSAVARAFVQKTLPQPVVTKLIQSNVSYSDDKRSILSTETAESNLLSLETLNACCADDILADQLKRSSMSSAGRRNSRHLNPAEVDDVNSRNTAAAEPKKKLNLFSKFIPVKKRGDERSPSGELRNFVSGSISALGLPASSWDEASSCSEGGHTARLADSVFLVGPGDEDIETVVQQYLIDSTGDYTGINSKAAQSSAKSTSVKILEKSSGLFSLGAASPSFSSSNFEKILEPKLLYLSNKDPEIEDEVLPFFCFPSGVATRVGPTSSTARNRSASRASPLGDFSPTTPSATTAGAAVSSIGNSRCFTFLLANNTSNQFGVCLQLPRTFRDLSKGVIVSCDYCVCVITKLPFLSYIFNLLMQLDALGGLDFSEPVQRLHPTSLQQPLALRQLTEFTRHLRGVRVPIYRLGPKFFRGDADYDDDDDGIGSDFKSTYQSVSFNMAMRSTVPGGSFSQLLDTISLSPLPSQSSSRYVSISPVTRGKSLVKRSLTGVFRRDLIGTYSALPFTPQMQHKNTIPTAIPDPPFLPSPKWPIDDNLLGQLEEDREKEVCFHTLLWALPALLRHLPLDQIILAIGCALTEMRVVVVGDDLGVVSGCVLALVNLLRPLRWAGPVIVTLPSSLHAYLESPVPLILGMQSLPEGFKLAPGIIMIDPKERMVNLHQTDVVASHTLILPKANKLMHSLRVTGEIILRLTRKRTGTGSLSPMGKEPVRKSSPQGTLRHSLSSPIETQNSSGIQPSLPIELDAESANGKKLMAAVCGFSATMASHIETVVNTVLQLAIEERRQRRISRQDSLLKEATRRYSLVALVSPPIGGVNPTKRQDLGRSKNSKKGSKSHIDGTVSPYSDIDGMSDKIQVKSKSSNTITGTGSQNVPGNVLHEISSDGSHVPAGDGVHGTALPVPRERVTIPSAVPHTHGQTMSESSSAANLNSTFGVPLMDSYLDSESDSEGDETSSGDDNRSRASTMTGTGSTMSVLPKHNRKTSIMFTRKDLGDGGLRFLARVRETQMFCNYCHLQSLRRRALRVEVEREALSARARMNLDLEFHNDVTPPNGADFDREEDLETASHLVSSNSSVRYLFRNGPGPGPGPVPPITEKNTPGPSEEAEDCLVTLFKIMLTGTIPMKRSKLNTLIASYERDEARVKSSYSRDTANPPTSAPSSSALYLKKNCDNFKNFIIEKDREKALKEKEKTVEEEILWCNGRCNGAADGPLCSSICMKLWAERVHKARKTLTLKRAIARQHHSDLVMNDVLLPDGGRISIRPRAEVVRHRKETVSQYDLRLKTDLHSNLSVEGDNQIPRRAPKVPRASSPSPYLTGSAADLAVKPYTSEWCSDTCTSSGFYPKVYKPNPPRAKKEDIYPEFPSTHSSQMWQESEDPYQYDSNPCTSPSHRPLSRGSISYNSNGMNHIDAVRSPSTKSNGTATTAIARHYVSKELQKQQSKISRAYEVLTPFLLGCLLWIKQRNQYIASVMIQSAIRGYFIRRDALHLVLFLRFRRALRMLARLFIRNWARKWAAIVYYRRSATKMQKIRNVSLTRVPTVMEDALRVSPMSASSGSRLSSSRTERTDISSVTNFDEGGRLGKMRKAASFTLSADHYRKNDSSPKAASRNQSYQRDGDGSGEDAERKPDMAGSNRRFFSEGETPPGPPTGFRRAPPNIPHLVGVPFSSPSTPTNAGCASPGDKKAESPMRKLSIQFGERAKGVFGFLRRGQKGHRESSSSLEFEGHKSQHDMESTPLDAAPLILHSHSVDSPRGNGRGRSITADAVSTPRSSLALSEDQDDLGTVIPFDPHSRQSSTHEMLPPKSFHGVPSTYTSIFALEEKDTPESLPPRAPHSANASGSSNCNIGNIEHLKTWFPQFDSPETNNYSRDHDRQSLDSIIKRTPQLSGRHSFTSPSPERAKRPEKMRKGSLTSVISTATVGSPDKYPYEKTKRMLTGGREGFEKEKDRTIPVFMRSTFKTRESTDGGHNSHQDNDSFDSESSETESRGTNPSWPGLGPEYKKPRSHSATFSDHGMVDYSGSGPGSSMKKGVSFNERLNEENRTRGQGQGQGQGHSTNGATESFGALTQHGLGQRQGQSSAIERHMSPSRRTSASGLGHSSSHSNTVSPAHPHTDASSARGSPDNLPPNTPVVRATAFPNLDPGSRPAVLLIPPVVVKDLGPRAALSKSLSVLSSPYVSSRSRQNSDASENYDVLLGIDNTFSLDNDDSQRVLRISHSSDSADDDDDIENSSGLSNRASSIKLKIKTKNRPSSIVLKSLGSAAKGNITPQQLHILIRMRDLLKTGVEVLKHGRGGRPKKRILYCESEFKKLCWRRPTDKCPVDDSDSPSVKRTAGCFTRLFGPANGPKSGIFSRAGCMKGRDDRTMLLSDILEVRDDIGTDVMRRSLAKQFVAGSEQTCVISIVLASRTLDFEIEEHSWRPIFPALQILVNYYRVILPQHQTQRSLEERKSMEDRRDQRQK